MIEIVENADQEPPDRAGVAAEKDSLSLLTDMRVFPSMWEFREHVYPHVSDKQWNDWHWQLANRITDADVMADVLGPTGAEAMPLGKRLPVAVTPYYLGTAAVSGSMGLRRCIEPSLGEFATGPGECADPLGEDGHSPVPGIVHRYPDRVLFLVTDFCSTYCRYCTRSRLVGRKSRPPRINDWKRAIDYIRETPAVRDVLLSGGDPLTLSDERLDWLLTELRSIPHVEIVRIGTKVPAVLPQRVTPKLTAMLGKHHPLFMSLHFAHPDELTSETSAACAMLADAGIPLGSQTVLLRGVNDDLTTMKKLMQGLLKVRVKPYYLYQCDPIPGSAHFRTPVEKGLEIMRGLRGHTSGYAVPYYVIDAPGGGGKIPLLPEYVMGREQDSVVLRNYEGKIYEYPDTVATPVVAPGGRRAM
ncbi:KamA family radical SAM protein [Pseudodesulfovibrio tunisiensis]|uniref:KamA family radical SAM protein n=1 Tax=Pseudodesulfovibrio tunisiensis TaxID=463192 RepID=UPI001FB1EDAC|nr:KamA family radical SAM protein [Pseudodesulfovibrio tunisiensis]